MPKNECKNVGQMWKREKIFRQNLVGLDSGAMLLSEVFVGVRNIKQVEVYCAEEDEDLVVITVMTKYF